MEKDFLHLIETRRSCRSYRPEQIADEQLEAILQAGTYAPSAMGANRPISWLCKTRGRSHSSRP